jgi:hypothetical protein
MPKSTTSFPEATGIYDSGTVIPGRSSYGTNSAIIYS